MMPKAPQRPEPVGAPLQYEADSAPALALNATIERTEKRFAKYANQNLLCGSDGLPHLISDPGLALRFGHAGETLVRTSAALCVLSSSYYMQFCLTGTACRQQALSAS